MKIVQRNLNSSTFFVWKMKRNVSVVRFKFRCNILISGQIIKEMPTLDGGGLRPAGLYNDDTFTEIRPFDGPTAVVSWPADVLHGWRSEKILHGT